MLKFHSLRDKVFKIKNLYSAFEHVKKNKGKAGLDKVSIQQFEADLDNNIQAIHNSLRTEVYKPFPVLRIFIPKGRNDKRPLGIPTVKDRVVQQAFRQIIEPIFEKEFSEYSFGFRPGRSCHDAINKVLEYKEEGYRYILDADIKAFYDTIPHQLIMKRLCEKVADGWVLNSIENMLNAGIMKDGVLCKSSEGVPQGGVLSPLLANLIGDIIDKELETRGLKFVRYADDFIVMAKKKNELPGILNIITDIVEKKLKMELSKDKTELSNFKRGFRFLGYQFHNRYKGISNKSVNKLKDNIRNVTKRTQGINIQCVITRVNPVIKGFVNYFQMGNVIRLYKKLDAWIRMRLRAIKFSRKWKTDNWRFKNKRFEKMGLFSLLQEHLKLVGKAG